MLKDYSPQRAQRQYIDIIHFILAFFAQIKVDPELETIVWPNGADLAPEYVFFKAFEDDPELQAQFKEWGYV